MVTNNTEPRVPAPLWINLIPNGKTLIMVYSRGENGPARQEKIAEALIDKMGEPEEMGFMEDSPDDLFMLWPHQNLPEECKSIAEAMTTQTLLKYLGVGDYQLC